jgi:hypothetical protein
VVRALLALTIVRPALARLIVVSVVAVGCQLPPSFVAEGGVPPLEASARRGQFRADPDNQPGDEAYLCYSIDVEGISGVHVGRVTWHPPSGPVFLHHASLFAAAGLPDVGEVPCDPMPTRVAALGVYTPGIEPLQLPDGVAIELPAGTQRLLVLAHTMRRDVGLAQTTYVDLDLAAKPVLHSVNWVDVFAPVPVLYPGDALGTVGNCQFAVPAHIVSVWAHMHRLGSEFHGVIVRADGTREPLLDVKPWDYNHQFVYPVDVQLEPGDTVQTQCHWVNTTSDVVLPGPYSTDEMCNQGLLVWPFDSALCAAQ